jgi:hypothetical protein
MKTPIARVGAVEPDAAAVLGCAPLLVYFQLDE